MRLYPLPTAVSDVMMVETSALIQACISWSLPTNTIVTRLLILDVMFSILEVLLVTRLVSRRTSPRKQALKNGGLVSFGHVLKLIWIGPP